MAGGQVLLAGSRVDPFWQHHHRQCDHTEWGRNTANQNTMVGISLSEAVANTVSDNTADENGDRGINLNFSNGNTLKRNTTDRNGSGITLNGDSHENTVDGNSATANGGEGIRLFDGPTRNTVQNNTVTGNGVGIRLFDAGTGVGASRNIVQSNTANENNLGISVGQASTGNSIQGNTALGGSIYDLEDMNPGCDSNAWTHNEFVTDIVYGASDGGPGLWAGLEPHESISVFPGIVRCLQIADRDVSNSRTVCCETEYGSRGTDKPYQCGMRNAECGTPYIPECGMENAERVFDAECGLRNPVLC